MSFNSLGGARIPQSLILRTIHFPDYCLAIGLVVVGGCVLWGGGLVAWGNGI